MSTRTITTKLPATEVERILSSIGDFISGQRNDRYSIGTTFWAHFAHELYSRIHDAYAVKAEGGTDDLGNNWPPISQKTKAKRQIGRGNLSEFGLTKKWSGYKLEERQRGLLTPEQNKVWKKTFYTMLKKFELQMDVEAAKQVAAKIAWGRVKAMGADTKLDIFGNLDALIMRETDRIYNSLEPSLAGKRGYRPRKEQLFSVNQGSITIGTEVPYAQYHDGTRPVIPNDIDKWVDEATEIAMEAALERALEVL